MARERAQATLGVLVEPVIDEVLGLSIVVVESSVTCCSRPLGNTFGGADETPCMKSTPGRTCDQYGQWIRIKANTAETVQRRENGNGS
jgi:hypothetical protein